VKKKKNSVLREEHLEKKVKDLWMPHFFNTHRANYNSFEKASIKKKTNPQYHKKWL